MIATQPTNRLRSKQGRRSRAVQAGAAAVIATLTLVDLSGAAHAVTPDSRHAVDLANWDRAIHGVRVIGISDQATWKAQIWAQHVAGTGTVEHSAGGMAMSPGGYTGNVCFLGENVGLGPSAVAIETAWMSSPAHRANILRPNWWYIGVGVAHRGNLVVEVQEFAQYRDASGACPH